MNSLGIVASTVDLRLTGSMAFDGNEIMNSRSAMAATALPASAAATFCPVLNPDINHYLSIDPRIYFVARKYTAPEVGES